MNTKLLQAWNHRVAGQRDLLNAWRASEPSTAARRNKRVDIYVSGVIDSTTMLAARHHILAHPHAKFVVHIDSPGGNMGAAIRLAAMLTALGNRVDARVVNASSAALLLCIAVHKAMACPRARFLHHSARREDTNEISRVPSYDVIQHHLLQTRAGASGRLWRALEDHGNTDLTFNASVARELGIVTSIARRPLVPVREPASSIAIKYRAARAEARREGLKPPPNPFAPPPSAPRPQRNVVGHYGNSFCINLDPMTVKSLAAAQRTGVFFAYCLPKEYGYAADLFNETGELLSRWEVTPSATHVPPAVKVKPSLRRRILARDQASAREWAEARAAARDRVAETPEPAARTKPGARPRLPARPRPSRVTIDREMEPL